jgi:predicted AlkP superfamily phosphohydrolase/phosphomutase
VVLALAGLVGACGRAPETHSGKRLVILGFDGVDPRLLSRWMDEGKLPKIKALIEKGEFRPLGSTNPPQSPVAWTTFATGTNPGKHGIFDFVQRDPKTYLPDVGTGGLKPPKFFLDLIETGSAEGYTERHGTPFWDVAATHGVHVTVLRVPYAFPPDKVPGGRMLSGLGVPDLLGTNSTFTYLASDLPPGKQSEPGGGRLVPIALRGDDAEVDVVGPADPRGGKRPPATLHVGFHVDRASDAVVVRFAGREEKVARGGWSEWFAFRVPVVAPLGLPLVTIDGICRFHVVSTDPLRVYLSPLNFAPSHPFAPISAPGAYAGELAKAVGTYKTVGWSEDTSALNAERIDEAAFLADLYRTMDDVRASTLHELARPDWDLLISVFTQTDRVAHLFYRLLDPQHPRYDPVLAARFGDAVERVYQRMDAIVGEIVEKLGADTTLLVISDHGFHSYRTGLNLNTWLKNHGFLVQGDVAGGAREGDFFPGVDWNKSRAYALGTGQIYVNLKGREGRGIVNKGAEYDGVLDGVVRGLEAEVDPANGERIVAKVYKGQDIFPGAALERMPDLQVAFREGYRTSWRTPLGGIPAALLEPNDKKWSGDHAASDVADTPGMVIANRRLAGADGAIVDLAPTALRFFGVPVPPEMEGHSLLE